MLSGIMRLARITDFLELQVHESEAEIDMSESGSSVLERTYHEINYSLTLQIHASRKTRIYRPRLVREGQRLAQEVEAETLKQRYSTAGVSNSRERRRMQRKAAAAEEAAARVFGAPSGAQLVPPGIVQEFT